MANVPSATVLSMGTCIPGEFQDALSKIQQEKIDSVKMALHQSLWPVQEASFCGTALIVPPKFLHVDFRVLTLKHRLQPIQRQDKLSTQESLPTLYFDEPQAYVLGLMV